LAIRFASRHFVPIRIALIVAVAFARLLLPAGYMPGATVAAEEWGGFVICYGAGDASLPVDDQSSRSAHVDCLFASAHNVALAHPPVAPRLPAPGPSLAATLPVDAADFCCKPRAYRNGARAPPSANDEIQIHIV